MMVRTMIVLGMVCGLAATVQAQTQTSVDGRVTLIQRDVQIGEETQRWTG